MSSRQRSFPRPAFAPSPMHPACTIQTRPAATIARPGPPVPAFLPRPVVSARTVQAKTMAPPGPPAPAFPPRAAATIQRASWCGVDPTCGVGPAVSGLISSAWNSLPSLGSLLSLPAGQPAMVLSGAALAARAQDSSGLTVMSASLPGDRDRLLDMLRGWKEVAQRSKPDHVHMCAFMISSLLKPGNDQERATLLVLDKGEVVAVARAIIEKENNRVFMRGMVGNPSWTGKGAARALLAYYASNLKLNDAERPAALILNAATANAEQMWAYLGFTRL